MSKNHDTIRRWVADTGKPLLAVGTGTTIAGRQAMPPETKH